ncbi:hypothetical protein BV25DRAFT_59643 [Artomyces pyxidatus]|uniref:Uncharacterized protein n=1 Tax=Artomyces pyxidatus TaxID=48021 RepID=A0ACB8TK98_9AGAM|nr:hypothetical protein BV25DRAFT_59643 [Artomyces pyxidatus]
MLRAPLCIQHEVPFPAPPTLADIQRMEPDLSPTSMWRRASDVDCTLFPSFQLDPRHKDSPYTHASHGVIRRPVLRDSEQDLRMGFSYDVHVTSLDGGHCGSVRDGRPSGTWQGVAADGRTQVQTSRYGDLPCKDERLTRSVIKQNTEASSNEKQTLSALAEWITGYIFALVDTGRLPDEAAANRLVLWRSTVAFKAAGRQIRLILEATVMPHSAVFLALWYIFRLPVSHHSVVYAQDTARIRFQDSLLGSDMPSIMEVRAVRIFMAGIMLADKWINDHTFHLKTWQEITGISCRTLNRLENAALAAFSYNLHVTPSEWQQWMGHIAHWHGCLAQIHLLATRHTASHTCITDSVCNVIAASVPDAGSRGADAPQFLPRLTVSSGQANAGAVQASPVHVVQPPRHHNKIMLPPPDEWSPEADPIVWRPSRIMGTAPCASQKHGTRQTFTGHPTRTGYAMERSLEPGSVGDDKRTFMMSSKGYSAALSATEWLWGTNALSSLPWLALR